MRAARENDMLTSVVFRSFTQKSKSKLEFLEEKNEDFIFGQNHAALCHSRINVKSVQKQMKNREKVFNYRNLCLITQATHKHRGYSSDYSEKRVKCSR